MTAQAAPVIRELRAMRMLKLHRAAIFALVPVSLFFIWVDTIGQFHLHALRSDMAIELFARFAMVVLATVCAVVTKGNRNTRLLMWALMLLSLDVYWQTAYGFGGKQWTVMLVKYLCVPAGLMCLIRFCAAFGDGDWHAARAYLYDWAPVAAGLLALIGIARGAAWIHGCIPMNGQCAFDIGDRWYLPTQNAYIIGDAFLRFAAIAAAAIGYASSSCAYRSQMLLIACSSMLFGLGTVLDFLARVVPSGDAAYHGLTVLDASTTLLFPIGLTLALFARQLFDVNLDYVIRRTLAVSIGTAIVVALFAAAHTLLVVASTHWLEKPLARYPSWIPEATVGFVLLLSFRPIEEWTFERLKRSVLPDRAERLESLREIGEHLLSVRTVDELRAYRPLERMRRALGIAFSAIFLTDGKSAYRPFLWNLAEEPRPIAETDDAVAMWLAAGKRAEFAARGGPFADALIAFPMFAGPVLYGILVCGRKYLDDSESSFDIYDKEELHELELLARQAGTVLYALHAAG